MTIQEINSCWIGTELARLLGLNNRFFSRLNSENPKSLNHEVKIHSAGGLILVRIPEIISNIVRSGEYTAVRVESGDDTEFDYEFMITNETRIGFWK